MNRNCRLLVYTYLSIDEVLSKIARLSTSERKWLAHNRDLLFDEGFHQKRISLNLATYLSNFPLSQFAHDLDLTVKLTRHF